MTAGTEQDRNVNLANRLANRLPRVYQVLGPAGWRRGYAADCKSTPALSSFSNSFNALPHPCGFANMRGQTGNETKIFQTAFANEVPA